MTKKKWQDVSEEVEVENMSEHMELQDNEQWQQANEDLLSTNDNVHRRLPRYGRTAQRFNNTMKKSGN